MDQLIDSPVLLCFAIFGARVLDVSLGTLRTILVFRAHRALAAMLGFVEVLIWVAAAGHVLQNLDEWYLAVSYAAGFATGNVVGIWLESKLAVGVQLVRAVSPNPEIPLAQHLRDDGYSVIALSGRGGGGVPVEVLLIEERRRRLPGLLRRIEHVDPDAVCTASDVKTLRTGKVVPATGFGLADAVPITIKRK